MRGELSRTKKGGGIELGGREVHSPSLDFEWLIVTTFYVRKKNNEYNNLDVKSSRLINRFQVITRYLIIAEWNDLHTICISFVFAILHNTITTIE